ncbi:adenylate cyclase [Enterovibrio norvegicus FF-162]|uniref:CYTH and CHAD domain-containing protein n=1 Tax=Enterovibrio norvegicus TaxID=188144 RepID=UPI0002DF9E78|nr:inorganic triphosphatase [Enterovibrio norvegicus]OEE89205.1 adenylate cyclase [Enterovibrio norvegicus FF-162]
METEIELKFFVSPDFSRQIRDKITDLKVLQQRQRNLGNIYYDTPDFLLRKHDIGLRVRRYDDVFVQTLKTAGRVVAGLHQRPEYNAELESPVPDLSLISADAWPDGLDVDALSANLFPLFSTDFERQQWLLAMPDSSQVELAFDSGEVTTKDGGYDPICEVEIELKSGQTDALFVLARELAENGGLRLGNLSKAARGYRLATGYQGDVVKSLSIVDVKSTESTEQAFVTALEHALEHWHYHEQIYVERPEQDAIFEMCSAVALIRQVLVLYGGLIPRRASALLRQELQWLEGELDWINEARAIERLVDDKGYFLRKLNVQKPLLSKLGECYDALPERAEVLELLHSSRYCNLLLDLSRWILTRGWQPFLDDKAREKLEEPIRSFANRSLAVSSDELLSVFSLENELDRFGYLDQQPRLTRNLLCGCCVAALYDAEDRETFRLPWLDLLQGIDDILLLEPVRKLAEDEDFSEDDKAQIEKWLRRKEESLLHAMMQSRQIGLALDPYWDQ